MTEYHQLAATVKLKGITSSASNRALLHRIKNNDPSLKHLNITCPMNMDPDQGPNDYEFVIREEDHLGWLGYFIGENVTVTTFCIDHLPTDVEQVQELFKGFERNETIRCVDIYVVNEGFTAIKMPHVKKIALDCQLDGDDARHFASGLRRCKSLQIYFGILTANILAVLSTLPLIETIVPLVNENGDNNFDWGRDAASALEQLLRNAKKLHHLDLGDMNLGNEAIEGLAAGLVHTNSLGICHLYGSNIGDEGIKVLAASLAINRSVKTLELGRNNIGDEGLKILASSLAHNRRLRVLDISGNNIGDEGLEALAKSLSNNLKLRELCLRSNNIGDSGLLALAASLGENRSLRKLSISENTAITEIGLTAVSRALHSRKCKLEDLCLNNIGDNGGNILASALSINKSLVSLSLSAFGGGVSISDDGLKALAAGLSRNSTLRSLYLPGNRAITSTGLDHLKQYFEAPFCALETLSISGINFGDGCAFAIANALTRNKSLKELYCFNHADSTATGITAVGWEAFSMLLCDPSSANNIYLSNHKLQTISYDWTLWRANITPWLNVNKVSQSQSMAAKFKILKCFPDLNMVPLFQWNLKFLPLVKSWFKAITICPNMASSDEEWGKLAHSIRRRELSAIYKFVRGMPSLTVGEYKHYLMRQLERIRLRKIELQHQIQRLEERECRLMCDCRNDSSAALEDFLLK